MTHAERYAALSLLATLAVAAFLAMRLTDGWSVPDQPAGLLLKSYVMAVAASILAEGVIAALLAQGRRQAVERDERDLAVQRRADQAAWGFAAVAVNVLVIQVLLEDAFAGHALPHLDLTSAPALVFVLLLVLYGATAVQRAATLVLYRLP